MPKRKQRRKTFVREFSLKWPAAGASFAIFDGKAAARE
jgi:hypothetical protein